MGVAYYIETDDAALDVMDVDGKSVARAMDALNALARELGVRPLEDFMGQSLDDLEDLLGEEIDVDDADEGAAQWFDPGEGLQAVAALVGALEANPRRVKSCQQVIEDLHSYRRALEAVRTAGARWHLAIDI